MLPRLFRYIRRKPREVRSRYALGFATTFTGVIAIFWVTNSSTFDFSSKNIAQNENKETSSFSTITKQAKEQLASLRDSVKDEVGTSTEEGIVSENDDNQDEASVQSQQNPTEIVLSDEDLEVIDQKDKATTTSTNTGTQAKYQEVLIATSSKATASSTTSE